MRKKKTKVVDRVVERITPKKKELCDKCGEKYVEELLECPSCGVHCCTDRCIAGRKVRCFSCEESAEGNAP